MNSDVLHIVFTPGGAWSLRRALDAVGRDDRVICLLDDLSLGPIAPPDPYARAAWAQTQLGFTAWPNPETRFDLADGEFGHIRWDELVPLTQMFWRDALSDGSRKIVWVTRRSAMEYAGFLEWLWRAGDTPFEIVDLTEAMVSNYRPDRAGTPPVLAVSLRRLWPEDIIANKLLDRAVPLEASDRSRYRALRQQLRAENAPFRVVSDQGLVSAPMSFFDDRLLSEAVGNWRKVAWIVGHVYGAHHDDNLHQTGLMVLASRIDALIESGRLEHQGGSPFAMRFSEVRLPRRPPLDG